MNALSAGVNPVRVVTMPPAVLAGMGVFWPLMRELRETDFVMDSSAAQGTFGLKPMPWEEIIAATAPGRG